MHRFTCLSVGLALAVAGPSAAQFPIGNGTPGGGRGAGRGGDTPRYAPSTEPLPSPEDLAGPGVPDFVVDRVELDSGEAQAYRVVYDSFMTATRPLRDSAQATRQRIDARWQARDRSGARALFPDLRRMGDALAKEDNHFDDRLKKVFTKAHYKDYRDWRGDQKKQAQQDREDRMKEMTDGEPPPGGI